MDSVQRVLAIVIAIFGFVFLAGGFLFGIQQFMDSIDNDTEAWSFMNETVDASGELSGKMPTIFKVIAATVIVAIIFGVMLAVMYFGGKVGGGGGR